MHSTMSLIVRWSLLAAVVAYILSHSIVWVVVAVIGAGLVAYAVGRIHVRRSPTPSTAGGAGAGTVSSHPIGPWLRPRVPHASDDETPERGPSRAAPS
jgi:hypothetical protein